MVLTFGEILLRLAPQLGCHWIEESSMPVYVGGSELNVARNLAGWDIPVSLFSSLPDNDLSEEIIHFLNQNNIDTSHLIREGERLGIYYLSQKADLKHQGVIYDRKGSSFSTLNKEKIDWNQLFDRISHFHTTAINPGLNQNIADVTLEAVKQARRRDLRISFDLNFRSKLWKYGKKPLDIISEIVKNVDVLMGNIWAVRDLLGVELKENYQNKNEFLDESFRISQWLMQKYPNLKTIAHTFRFDKWDGGVTYYATLYDGLNFKVSKQFDSDFIVDKVGSGDSFMAALIYGLIQGFKDDKLINFAASAALGKLMLKGDAHHQPIEDILNRFA